MQIDFSNRDVLLIYEQFKKKLEQVEKLKTGPVRLDSKSYKQEIELYTSITSKIEAAYPEVRKLSDLM